MARILGRFAGILAAASIVAAGAFLAPCPASAADLTVTAASVAPVAGAAIETGYAGEALTAGQAVYRKSADGKWYKADCNSATAEVRVASAVALTGSAAGQPVVVQRAGSVTIGAALTAGTVYYLSGTPGGIRPAADNTTGDYPQVVGIATSTTVLSLNFGLRATSPL
jgi:hypothetical protein